MKFNSNKERQAYWEQLHEMFPPEEVQKAIATLKPDIIEVLELHYRQNLSFREIAVKMNRSVTIIRNHHNRGIYKLYRYFNPRPSETA